MTSVAVDEARNRLPELLAELSLGAELTITRHGKAVARLPVMDAPNDTTSGQGEQVTDAMHRVGASGLSWHCVTNSAAMTPSTWHRPYAMV